MSEVSRKVGNQFPGIYSDFAEWLEILRNRFKIRREDSKFAE